MAVDYTNPAHILAVHGVQLGEDEDIESGNLVRDLVNRSLSDSSVEKDFVVNQYNYEDINDDAQKLHQLIASALAAGVPILKPVLGGMIDIVGDVLSAAWENDTADEIRVGLRDAILSAYQSNCQLIVVAHSLGTVYALDVINDLIDDSAYFKGDDRTTWPVQGFISMGSPLGMAMDIAGTRIFAKRKIHSIQGAHYCLFPWHNFYNPLDPIVSGDVFGSPVPMELAKGPIERRYGPSVKASNWMLRPHVVTSGEQWLMAHTAYWTNPSVGDQIMNTLWG